MDTLIQDLRYAFRALLRNPGFTAAAVVTLSLGIGATTAVFSLLDRVVLRPLPVAAPNQLVHVVISRRPAPDSGEENTAWNLSYPSYLDARDRAGVFSGVLAQTGVQLALRTEAGTDRLEAVGVSAGYFGILGVALPLGRDILPDEDRVGAAAPVVILSHAIWQRRFNADAGIIGRAVTLNGRPFTVIGVTPLSFSGLERGRATQAWVPLTGVTNAGPTEVFGRRTTSWLDVFARLSPGVSMERATAALRALDGRLHAEGVVPRTSRFKLLDGSHGMNALVSELKRPLQVLMVAVLLVLAVACANVAGLLLARASTRRREIAVRLSVGAARGRLVRQLVTESFVLAVLGALGGLAVASWIGDVMPTVRTLYGTPLAVDQGFDLRVLLFVAAATTLTAVGFGLAPALSSTRPDLAVELKAGAAERAGQARFGARDLLVVGQVALSLVLLSSAALLARSAGKLRGIDPGYDPRGVLLVGVDVHPRGYDGARIREFWSRLLARVGSAPGVETATMAMTMVPNPGGMNWGGVPLEGSPSNIDDVSFDVNLVGPSYFETMRIPVIRGRGIVASDGAGAPRVAVINDAMAKRYWPGQDPIGHFIRTGTDSTAESIQIVGVVGDGKYRDLREEAVAVAYWSALQTPASTATLIVRARAEPLELAALVRREVRALDAEVPVFDVRTLEDHLAVASSREQLVASVAGLFSGVGLALAAVGLFGLLAFAVARRTREIGVRMAVGARQSDVVRMIVRQGVARVGAGIVIGTAAALATTRFLRSMLYGVEPTDPAAFGVAALLLLVVGMAAAWIPARRAAAIDPMVALRND